MNKQTVIRMLLDYVPTKEEQQTQKDMLAFMQKYDDCFERSLLIGHMTASAWLLNKDGSHALLMHHAKLYKWMQVGGHCDGEQNILAVAIKEAQEESGIQSIEPVFNHILDIDIHTIPEYKGVPAHNHYDVRFLLRVASDEDVVQNHESKELRWISKDRAQLPTHSRSVIRMFDKWVALSPDILVQTQSIAQTGA